MLQNEKQKEFLKLRIIDGKAFETISTEIGVDIDRLKEWSISLIDQIEEIRANEIDKIAEEFKINPVTHFKNLADVYLRSKNELDKRDFTGLPTDKLYQIFNDVRERMDHFLEFDIEEDWDDYYDESEYPTE